MYIVWRDSMYYMSEEDHICILAETKEQAIEKSKEYTEYLDTKTCPYIEDGILEFERSHYSAIYYLTEIPHDCKTLHILQCVGFDGSVKIFFDDDEYSIKRELDWWIDQSVDFKYDSNWFVHWAQMEDGSRFDLYVQTLDLEMK